MLKTKFCSFAVAGIICIMGILGIRSITAFAANTDQEPETFSEINNDKKDHDKAAYKEKMMKAAEKWNALSQKQKDEVYVLLENELQAKGRLMDKLTDLGVMQKTDAEKIKTRMAEHLKKAKESGELPLLKYKER